MYIGTVFACSFLGFYGVYIMHVTYDEEFNFTNFTSGGLDASVVSTLKAFGHTLVEESTPFNIVNAVAKINETVEAIADTRGGGEADII